MVNRLPSGMSRRLSTTAWPDRRTGSPLAAVVLPSRPGTAPRRTTSRCEAPISAVWPPTTIGATRPTPGTAATLLTDDAGIGGSAPIRPEALEESTHHGAEV